MPPKFRDLDADNVEVVEEYDAEKGRITIESITHSQTSPNQGPFFAVYLDDVILEENLDRVPTREEVQTILEDVEWDDGEHLLNIYGWQGMLHGFLMIIDGFMRIILFGYSHSMFSVRFLLWALTANHEKHNPIIRKGK